MSVREFLDTEAGFKASGAFEAVFNAPHSLMMLIKPLALPAPNPSFMSLFGSGLAASVSDGGSNRLAYFTATEDTRATVGLIQDAWQLLFITKGAEATKPRMHRMDLAVGTWTHADSTGDAITYKPAVLSEVRIGEFTHMLVGVASVFDTALSDSDIEAVGAVRTSQLLVDLGAVHLWSFDQASSATAIPDLVGGANQTTISSGTVVVTTDNPPSWDFDVTVIPPLNFSLKMSGGAANADPAASRGGAKSSVAVGADLFDDVTNAERVSGLIDYRLIYVQNDDVADGSVVAYVPTNLESGREIAVGVPTQAANATVAAEANDTTPPSGVSFSAPTTPPAGISLGTIPAGGYRGLWIRRTVTSNTAQDPTNLATVKLEITRTS